MNTSNFLSHQTWLLCVIVTLLKRWRKRDQWKGIHISFLLQAYITALMIAVYHGHSHIVEVLTRFKPDVNLQSKVGVVTYYSVCVSCANFSILNTLIDCEFPLTHCSLPDHPYRLLPFICHSGCLAHRSVEVPAQWQASTLSCICDGHKLCFLWLLLLPFLKNNLHTWQPFRHFIATW